ncbi:hypothetical protein BZA77DRAFT_135832 [Pyronema omphalodes]|nr:hypothetical protein BZA77DRAFT_135832 [Pyronema omphalodes]
MTFWSLWFLLFFFFFLGRSFLSFINVIFLFFSLGEMEVWKGGRVGREWKGMENRGRFTFVMIGMIMNEFIKRSGLCHDIGVGIHGDALLNSFLLVMKGLRNAGTQERMNERTKEQEKQEQQEQQDLDVLDVKE